MERIPFSQVLKNASFDARREYDRLYEMFYIHKIPNASGGVFTLKDYCEDNFVNYPFRGTCISLYDFNDCYKYYFEKVPLRFDLDYLVSFCEYSYNLVIYLNQGFGTLFIGTFPPTQLYLQQVLKVIETIGYMSTIKEGITDFVPKDQAAISVAEIVDSSLSYRIIEYNHHSMKGEPEKKRGIVLALADKLEPQRNKLKGSNTALETDLFFLFNKLNIRHNNQDPEGQKYISLVADMGPDEIEKWYDDIYQMCLLAFLELDHLDRKKRVKQLKEAIENKKT